MDKEFHKQLHKAMQQQNLLSQAAYVIRQQLKALGVRNV